MAEALPTETAVPTPPPSPTATPVQMDSSRTDAPREDEAKVVVEATAISDDSLKVVGDMVAKDDKFGGTLRVVAQSSLVTFQPDQILGGRSSPTQKSAAESSDLEEGSTAITLNGPKRF